MPTTTPPLRFGRLLLTGAAGGLGAELRQRLKPHCHSLRLSDIDDLGTAAPGQALMPAALQDTAAVLALLQGVGAAMHLGGVATGQPWAPILQANIIGVYNLYEAARQRVIWRAAPQPLVDGGQPLVVCAVWDRARGGLSHSIERSHKHSHERSHEQSHPPSIQRQQQQAAHTQAHTGGQAPALPA